MSGYRTCDGCKHLCTEDAGMKEGKAYTFFICKLGKFDRCARPVIEHVPQGERLSVLIPAWCKKGVGYALQADGKMRREGEAYGQEDPNQM